MNTSNTVFLTMLGLSTVSLVLGIILMVKDSPYGKILSTLHKLSSFIAGVLFGIIVFSHFRSFGVTVLPLIVAILTIVMFIVSVTSGSILISMEVANSKMKLVHRFTSVAVYVFGIVTLYLLNII
ncbi:MAG: hypothetical protein MUP82_01860 [Candidatus Marinimicrobia bacterium]|nr:hypothetical protein [Candidatus Neomarinimicrobiota bacterium]